MIIFINLKCENDLWYYKDKLFTGQSINSIGDKFWYKEGKYHRENDLPAIENSNGTKKWYKEGKYHRENGPAVEYINGEKFWYHNNEINEIIDCKDQKEFEKIIKLLIFE